jgi:NAD(P)-dependent dehydrogenase (short-subunit alcohol dehydrogenase family)
MGARIVQIARDRGRGEAALARLRKIAPGVEHAVHYADLSVIGEMKRVAGEIAAAEARVDVLINNAGAMFNRRYESADGLELTFALNHVAYFVITSGLMERLKSSGAARIVSTASDAHKMGRLDFEDLQSVKARPGFQVYGRSKLCNILFTRELARRLVGTGVTANCLHPGFVATRFGDAVGGLMSFGIGIAKRFALTPEEGAKTLVYLASSKEVAGVSGEYFHKCRAIAPSAAARDDAAAQRLWEETARLAGS